MNTTPTTPQSPRERASQLVNDFASKTALLTAATADTRAQITTATAALNQASAPYLMELARIEEEAKALALQHGPEIFGDKRSFTENGYKLGLTVVEEVEMDADEQTVCRIILADLRAVEREIEEAETAGDRVKAHQLTYQRLALTSLLNIKYSINKPYVKDNADESADWFECYGIRVDTHDSASLKKAPPPRAAKAKQKKTPKPLQATEQVEEQEAA